MSKTLCFAIVLLIVIQGCTIHPPGEREERNSAELEGKRFVRPAQDRQIPTLSPKPNSDELVRYALLASPELEQRYWEWRSAIEQIPQDGTQATNLVLSAGAPITRGSTGFNRTTVTVANDPMADIVWPSKLGTAATRALQNAKAAGFRFQKAKYDLRQKVLDRYYDYLLATQLIKLDQTDLNILNTSAAITEAEIDSGKATQSDAIKAHNQADLLQNQITEQQSQLPSLRVKLNVAMGRDPAFSLDPATSLLTDDTVSYTQEQLLSFTVKQNPELAANDAQSDSEEQSIHLAQLQYLPDFSVSLSSDLAGNVQNLLGTLTVPLLRYQAINAAIAQAQANLRSAQAMRRQTLYDLRARVIADIAILQATQQQLELFEQIILPRTRESAQIIQASYETGSQSMSDLFEARRSTIAVEKLVLQLKITREKLKVDLEAVAANKITELQRQ